MPPGLNHFSEMMMLSGTWSSKFRSFNGSNKDEREVEEGEECKGCEDEGDKGKGDKGKGDKDRGDKDKGDKGKGDKGKGCEDKGDKDEGNEDGWSRHVGTESNGSSSDGSKIPENMVHASNRGIRKETGDKQESTTGSNAIGSLIGDEVHVKCEGPVISAQDGESSR